MKRFILLVLGLILLFIYELIKEKIDTAKNIKPIKE